MNGGEMKLLKRKIVYCSNCIHLVEYLMMNLDIEAPVLQYKCNLFSRYEEVESRNWHHSWTNKVLIKNNKPEIINKNNDCKYYEEREYKG